MEKTRGTAAEKLREARETRGMTLEELAAAAGTSTSQIRAYERGEAVPRDEMKYILASALGADVMDLFFTSLVEVHGKELKVCLPDRADEVNFAYPVEAKDEGPGLNFKAGDVLLCRFGERETGPHIICPCGANECQLCYIGKTRDGQVFIYDKQRTFEPTEVSIVGYPVILQREL